MQRRVIQTGAWLAGGLVIAVGILGFWQGLDYPLGTARRMGPGYLPLMLSGLMIVLGVLLVLVEGRRPEAGLSERPAVRGFIAVLASICAFALLIERFGLVPAVVATVLISSLADARTKPVAAVILAAAAALLAVVIFIWGLSLPMDAFRW